MVQPTCTTVIKMTMNCTKLITHECTWPRVSIVPNRHPCVSTGCRLSAMPLMFNTPGYTHVCILLGGNVKETERDTYPMYCILPDDNRAYA